MNENILQLIEKFTQRVRQIMDAYRIQADQITALKQQNETLLGTIQELKQQNEVLSQKRNTQITAQAMETVTGGKEEARDKIDRLVREIDKCITMLDD